MWVSRCVGFQICGFPDVWVRDVWVRDLSVRDVTFASFGAFWGTVSAFGGLLGLLVGWVVTSRGGLHGDDFREGA